MELYDFQLTFKPIFQLLLLGLPHPVTLALEDVVTLIFNAVFVTAIDKSD